MALTDALSIAFALLLAYWVRFNLHVTRAYFVWLLIATPL